MTRYVKSVRRFLILSVVWLLIAVGLPSGFSAFELAWDLVPYYYITACVYLFFLFVVSYELCMSKRYFFYILFLLLAFLGFYKIPQVLIWLDLGADYEALARFQQLRVNFIFRSMLRLTIAMSMIYHFAALAYERQKIAQARLQAELTMLKSQMTPHFFFNSLNAIYGLSLAKSEKVPRAIISLSDMMRYVLTDAKRERISITQELAYLGRYVELQKLRLPLNTKLHYDVELKAEFDIPPMLLITFYENAFKYGASSQKEEDIVITLKADEKTLHLSTHNAIILEKRRENSTATGIANARQRLELLYPNCYELTTSEQDGYYHVDLIIKH